MPIEFASEPGLFGSLIDPATGVPDSIPFRLPSGSSGSVPGGLIRFIKWTPVTAATLEINLTGGIAITASSGAVTSELITVDANALTAYDSCDGHFEAVLKGNPLAIDNYGNPIAAARNSSLDLTVKNGADTTVGFGSLSVTEANQSSILTQSSVIHGTDWIRKFSVSNVTANGCALYFLLLTRTNPD